MKPHRPPTSRRRVFTAALALGMAWLFSGAGHRVHDHLAHGAPDIEHASASDLAHAHHHHGSDAAHHPHPASAPAPAPTPTPAPPEPSDCATCDLLLHPQASPLDLAVADAPGPSVRPADGPTVSCRIVSRPVYLPMGRAPPTRA